MLRNVLAHKVLYAIWTNGNVNLELLKEPITKAFYIGNYIYDWYIKNDINDDSYTRFNIYSDGSRILNDHRSAESFIKKENKDGKVLKYGKRN